MMKPKPLVSLKNFTTPSCMILNIILIKYKHAQKISINTKTEKIIFQ